MQLDPRKLQEEIFAQALEPLRFFSIENRPGPSHTLWNNNTNYVQVYESLVQVHSGLS